MKFASASVLLAAALGVSAHPSGHAHKRAHNVEARGEFVIANKPVQAPTTTSAPIVVPTPTPTPSKAAPAPAKPSSASPSPSSSASSGGQGASVYTPFCANSNSKRATAEEIAYAGNVGSAGDYGCNIMTIQNHLIDQYDYTIQILNAGNVANTVVCWNKIGADHQIDGFFNGHQALEFTVAPGETQTIAVDSNSQIGCSFGPNGPELSPIGQFCGTWIEADFGNLSNGGWSGADASSIVAAANKMPIPGLQLCGTGAYASKCSTIFEGGKGENAFVGGTEALDGLGLNLIPGPQSLKAVINYQG